MLASCVLLALLCLFFRWVRDVYAASPPEPSVWGGYYEEAFTLKLTAPGNGSIYYTTDGSLPTADSTLYRDGIQIRDRSGEPNYYTSIPNVVTDWKNFTPSADPVPKGTVVRAIFISDQGVQSEALTQTYFVGLQPPERGYTLSLVFEEGDLFGEDGIYVTGRDYDEWYLAGDLDQPEPAPNFFQKGEVPATMELMGPQGDVLNQSIGLKIQGNTARAIQKKRFTLTARSEFGGSEVFDKPLFDDTATHSVMLKAALPDAMIHDLVSDRAVATQRSIPVRVFLNGEFWYDSYMLERYDREYFRQHYNVSDGMLIKDGLVTQEDVTGALQSSYDEFMTWVSSTDFSDPDLYERFRKKADIQSYIDFIAINYYLCNIDFNDTFNYVLWQGRSVGSSAYEDMRYRWCIYDIDTLEWIKRFEYAGDAADVNVFRNDISWQIHETAVFRALRANPEFNRQFVLSFMDMVNNNFAPANVERVLAGYGQDLSWTEDYFRKRPGFAARHLAEEFGLTGSLETVTVSCENPEMGSVTVNTSAIDLSGGSWSGQYYTDYPITVTAVPGDGYKFIGWKGGASETADTLTLSVAGGLTLEAVFAEK